MLHRLICAKFPEGDTEVEQLAMRVLKSHVPSRAPECDLEGQCKWSQRDHRWELSIPHNGLWKHLQLRSCLLPILRILRCHQDIQWWHGRGALLRYVSGYASKYGESLTDEALDIQSNPFITALNLCRSWKAAAPEQMMTLARESMSFTSVHRKHYRPLQYNNREDLTMYLYRRRDASVADLTCLEWLRQTTVEGSFESGRWAAKPRTITGMVAIAVEYNDFPKDTFFWQWLQMNIVHRLWTNLLPANCWDVDTNLRFYAAAIHIASEKWSNDAWIRNYLELCGNRTDYIETKVNELRVRRSIIAMQQQGMLPRSIMVRSSDGLHQLSRAQEIFANLVIEDMEKVYANIFRVSRVWILTGGPGSGKTFVIKHLIKIAEGYAFRVMIAHPTGKLSSGIRSKDNSVSTTIHRAFMMGTFQESLEYIQHFNIWIIGEMSMLTRHIWERIYVLWCACDKVPIVVCEGDFQQLAPPVPDAEDQDSLLLKCYSTLTL